MTQRTASTNHTTRPQHFGRILVPTLLATLCLASLASAGGPSTSWASFAVASSQFAYAEDPTNPGYDPIFGSGSAMQATGPPNAGCNGLGRAWNPLPEGLFDIPETEPRVEALVLGFNPPVTSPSRLDIYETDTAGSVVMVELISTTGEAIVFEGTDTTPCGGVLRIPLSQAPIPEAGAVVGVVIHTAVWGYEGIDAVGLVS